MNILQINTVDCRGGAAQVAYNLKNELKKRGHFVSMLAAHKTTLDNDVFLINPDKMPGALSKLSKSIIKKDLPSFIKYSIRDIYRALIANDIEFFSCNHILSAPEFKNSDIIHCHNFHGNYFNLKLLEKISKIKPIVWTLHDMWAVTGHCAHSFACGKWRNGCENCPDLKIYPPLFWDNTKYLWNKKKEIYNNSKLNIAVPSSWLKRKAEKSILKNQNIKLIYNGIDIKSFKQHIKDKARKKLNLPINKKIITFIATGGKKNEWKGWSFFRNTINRYKNDNNVLFLCIGGRAGKSRLDNVKYIEYITDKLLLAQYYSASDIFLFTSLAENFPLVILEAMACGIPIVSFDVGGVKEAMIHKKNGYIAKYKDEKDLINGIEYIFGLSEYELQRISQNSIQRVRENFILEIMADNYLKLYQKILNEK